MTNSSSAGGWTLQEREVGIRIRMYRVGFGDFFLLSLLPAPNQPVHIIIDCGVFKGTSGEGDIGSIEAAVADMATTTQGDVALIIMTHRHADHIAGFARCADTYKKLRVGAVWMPIWESEYSPAAIKFQAQLAQAAAALRIHFTALSQPSAEQVTARRFMENATGPLESGAVGSNAKALDLLKHGLSGVTPGYYTEGDVPTLPQALRDAGLAATILGPPPIDDLDLMKLMDLQKGVGEYLAAEADPETTERCEPFGSVWEVKAPFPHAGLREWLPSNRSMFGWAPPATIDAARIAMENALKASQPAAAIVAATQLNSFLNNQSLVVLFQFKGKRLLFVGDAQAGNWEHWLYKTNTPDKTGGAAMASDAQSILSSLDFYKVGHHGSTNATPKAVVEALGPGDRKLAAMCSTQDGVYGKENPADPSKGTEVPRIPLLAALGVKCALVRSDQVSITVNNTPIEAAVSAPLPTPSASGRFEPGAVWVDCYL
jgi:hypothetical protein